MPVKTGYNCHQLYNWYYECSIGNEIQDHIPGTVNLSWNSLKRFLKKPIKFVSMEITPVSYVNLKNDDL